MNKTQKDGVREERRMETGDISAKNTVCVGKKWPQNHSQ